MGCPSEHPEAQQTWPVPSLGWLDAGKPGAKDQAVGWCQLDVPGKGVDSAPGLSVARNH